MKTLHKKSVMLGLGLGLSLIYSTSTMATGSIEPMKNKGVTTLTVGEAISHRQSAFALIERDAKLVGKELKAKEVFLVEISLSRADAPASFLSTRPLPTSN